MSNSECKSNKPNDVEVSEGLIDIVTQLAYKVFALESIVAQRLGAASVDMQILTRLLDRMTQEILVFQAQVMASQVHIARLTETTEKQAQRIASMQDKINKLHQRKGTSLTLKMVDSDND